MKDTSKLQVKVQKILSEEFTYKKVNMYIYTLLLLLFVNAVAIYSFHSSKFFYYFIVSGIALVLAIFYFYSNKIKIKHAREKLREAFNSIRVNNKKRAIEQLIATYEISQNSKVLEFLFLYSTHFNAGPKDESIIAKMEYSRLKGKNSKDRRLIEILKKIIDANRSIVKHSQIIDKSKEKMQRLNDLDLTDEDDENLVKEKQKILDSYSKIITKSQSRIESLNLQIKHLVKMKYNFLITKELIKAREELKNLEEELWNDTVFEDFWLEQTQTKSTKVKDIRSILNEAKEGLDEVNNI